jgi:hypothetical protein
MEALEDAAADWMAQVRAAADATLLPTVPHSWYMGANVPGKPRVFLPYAGGMTRYRAICDEVAAEGWRGFLLDGKTGGGPRPAPAAARDRAEAPGV